MIIDNIDSDLDLQEICDKLNLRDLIYKFKVTGSCELSFGSYEIVSMWLPQNFPSGEKSNAFHFWYEHLSRSKPYFIKLALDKDCKIYTPRCWRKFEDDVHEGRSQCGKEI